jgi:putative peptidoglycan lipid II flippase
VAAWALAHFVGWPAGLWGRLLQTSLGTGIAFALYGLIASLAGVPEALELLGTLRRRLPGLPGRG